MPIQSLDELFEDTLRDVYWAEKFLVKALPKMAKGATDPKLKKAIEDHLRQTQGQVERLEKVFGIIGKAPRGKKCEAMAGLGEEGDHVLGEVDDNAVRDIGIIGAAQAVEHYEIARYGTLCAWAKQLRLANAAKLLNETLREEEAADELLSRLSQVVNGRAEAKKAA